MHTSVLGYFRSQWCLVIVVRTTLPLPISGRIIYHSKAPTSSRLGKVRVGGEKGSSGVSVRVERHAGERDKEKSLDACGKPRSRNDHFVVTGGVGSAQMNICDSRVTSMHDDHAVHTPEDRSFNLLQHG